MNNCVDVFIPCYKYAHFLEDCVKSVLTQSDVNVRVLILDDASPDNTPEVGAALAAADSRVSYRRSKVNKGHIATYNEGIEWASATFYMLLSADDYLLPGALGRAVELMTSDPRLGFAFGNALVLHGDGKLERLTPLGTVGAPSQRTFSGRSFVQTSGAINIVPTPTAIIRTSLQKQVGGYRTELPHSGDMEMWLRLASYSDVGFINCDQAVYRRHQSNMSLDYLAGSALPDLRQRLRALEIFFECGNSDVSQDRDIRNFLQRHLAQDALRHATLAFNEANPDGAVAIKQFALSVSPDIRRSWNWAKLAIKQAIGARTWRAINSVRSHY